MHRATCEGWIVQRVGLSGGVRLLLEKLSLRLIWHHGRSFIHSLLELVHRLNTACAVRQVEVKVDRRLRCMIDLFLFITTFVSLIAS